MADIENSFDAAARTARPDCPKCGGTGTFMYDHNHGTICDLCCRHLAGWWLLKDHYGDKNGKWCCGAGCGALRDDPPSSCESLEAILDSEDAAGRRRKDGADVGESGEGAKGAPG